MQVGFQGQLFMKKPRKNLLGVLISQHRSKAFLTRSSAMQNMFGWLHFKRFFMDVFKNPKLLEEACHILSQYGAT